MKKLRPLYILIVIGIVITMCISSIGSFLLGYYIGAVVHDPYIQQAREVYKESQEEEEEENIEEEEEESISEETDYNGEIRGNEEYVDTFTFELTGQDKTVTLTTATTSGWDTTGFQEQIQNNPDIQEYRDNNENFGSAWSTVYFFRTQEILEDHFVPENANIPSETNITIGDTEYEFLYRNNELIDDVYLEQGFAYQIDPTDEINDIKVSRLLSYYGYHTEKDTLEEILDKGTKHNLCMVDLSSIDEDTQGYLVFAGATPAGTNIDYCIILEDIKVFDVSIE